MPAHKPVVHTNCETPHCMICDGGLFLCEVCHSFEGGCTTDCPGERMTQEQIDKVYAGEVDYVAGKGWINEPSPHSPAYCRAEWAIEAAKRVITARTAHNQLLKKADK